MKDHGRKRERTARKVGDSETTERILQGSTSNPTKTLVFPEERPGYGAKGNQDAPKKHFLMLYHKAS